MSAYGDLVLSLKPAAYFPLDEPSGSTVMRDVLGGPNGTWQNPTTRVEPGLAPGSDYAETNGWNLGSGTRLDNSYQSYPITWNANSFTVSLWIKLTSSPGSYARIIAMRSSSGSETGSYVGTRAAWAGSYGNSNPSPFVVGKTHHVVIVSTPQGVQVYKDNVLVWTPFTKAMPRSSLFYVGNGYSSDNVNYSFPGVIDQVACFDRALSLPEIKLLYKGVQPTVGTVAVTGTVRGTQQFTEAAALAAPLKLTAAASGVQRTPIITFGEYGDLRSPAAAWLVGTDPALAEQHYLAGTGIYQDPSLEIRGFDVDDW